VSITENGAETAVRYLAETEEQFAKAVGRRSVADDLQKIALSQEFLAAEGKSIAEREAKARTSERYLRAVAETEDAYTAEALYRAKRLRYETTIEIWRTQESSRRRGNV
jgi:hypothetical protein